MGYESFVERTKKGADLIRRGIETGAVTPDDYTIKALRELAYQGNVPLPGTNRIYDPEKEALPLAEYVAEEAERRIPVEFVLKDNIDVL